VTSIPEKFLYNTKMIPIPTATSAAASAKMNNEKTCPVKFPCNAENATKFKFAAFSMSSMEMRNMRAFRRVSTPKRPMEKIAADNKI
jgi:hypothetical protein